MLIPFCKFLLLLLVSITIVTSVSLAADEEEKGAGDLEIFQLQTQFQAMLLARTSEKTAQEWKFTLTVEEGSDVYSRFKERVGKYFFTEVKALMEILTNSTIDVDSVETIREFTFGHYKYCIRPDIENDTDSEKEVYYEITESSSRSDAIQTLALLFHAWKVK